MAIFQFLYNPLEWGAPLTLHAGWAALQGHDARGGDGGDRARVGRRVARACRGREFSGAAGDSGGLRTGGGDDPRHPKKGPYRGQGVGSGGSQGSGLSVRAEATHWRGRSPPPSLVPHTGVRVNLQGGVSGLRAISTCRSYCKVRWPAEGVGAGVAPPPQKTADFLSRFFADLAPCCVTAPARALCVEPG